MILHNLPYKLPAILIPYLLYYAVSGINMIPRRTQMSPVLYAMAESPQELFNGRRIDVKLDLKLQFGEYVEYYSGSDNTMGTRTRPALAMMSLGNGSWRLFTLDKLTQVSSHQWNAPPISNGLIDHINHMSDGDSDYIVRGLDFKLNGKIIDETPDDELPISVNTKQVRPTRSDN